LFASTVINYIDRQTLSLLSPYLKALYHWTNSDYANLLIGFRIAYSIGQSVCGRLMDRVGTRRGLSLSVLWYSIVSMATSLVGGFYSFATFRFLLGAGESANWPGATKAVSEWFPKRERALATALFDSGSSLGGAVAPFIVFAIYNHWGWRPAFAIPGMLGFLWLLIWRFAYYPAKDHPRLSHEERQMILADVADPDTFAGKTSLPVGRPFEDTADVGSDYCEIFHRPRLVLHRRLVSDLSGSERLSAEERIDRNLDPLHRRRSRQFLRGSELWLSDQAGLDTGRGPQGSGGFRGVWSDFADTDGSYRQACADHCSFRSGDILLCRVLDDCQRVAFRPLPERFGGVGQWTERHERGHWAIIAFKLVGYFSDAKQSLATHSFDTIIIVAGLVPFTGMILVLFLVRNTPATKLGRVRPPEHEAAVVHRSF
jgi:ACS family hexuronate transporter-like MFS transporter